MLPRISYFAELLIWFCWYVYVFFFQVINLYMELLKERERREPKKFLKCHFFNTFFYKKVCKFTHCPSIFLNMIPTVMHWSIKNSALGSYGSIFLIVSEVWDVNFEPVSLLYVPPWHCSSFSYRYLFSMQITDFSGLEKVLFCDASFWDHVS
jgi:hypothetical protein